MARKFSEWLVEHRYVVLGVILLGTLFFAWQLTKIKVESRFSDLLPKDHPYIKVHNEYKDQLGDPLKVFLMLRVTEGNIYNQDTLTKIKHLTDELDELPGVNHNQVYSIGSRKIKKITVTTYGIITENFMDKVPKDQEEMEGFTETVRNTNSVYGIWVSPDEKSALFMAGFIPELVNYNVLFERVREIVEGESDANHEIYVAGEPVLKGWVHHYQQEMYWIFGVTFLTLFVLLYVYFRNLVGMVVPIVSTVVGVIWGLGFCGFVGYNLEPLTLVIPLLIAARALSHSVQVTERYFECFDEIGDVKAACVESATSILPPGTLGIVTDSLGIFLIAVAPVPIVQKMAFLCGFWASSIFLTGLILTPLLISFFAPPGNIHDIVDVTKGKTQAVLRGIARLGFGTPGKVVFGVTIVLFVITGWISSKVNIGDINPGTPILWPDSDYNVAIDSINANFPGTDELYVIVEGNTSVDKAIAEPAFMDFLYNFQRHMERNPEVAATLSLVDLITPINKSVHGGYPLWEIYPRDRYQNYELFSILTGSSAPGDYDRFVSRDENNANVIIWYKDHMGDTIRNAIDSAREFIDQNKASLEGAGIKFRLASGSLGLLAAVNETVQESQIINFLLVMGLVFILCSITYRSMVAAVILMIPLNLANLVTLSIMHGLGIGLNINTLPIVSVGVGVGIDYGIYLLSRLCEEYNIRGEYSFETASTAIGTTGKAIFFTATTMIVGVIFWYFLSSLRFQAEMGLLLAIVMLINMLGALLIIPSLVFVFKPKFLGRVKLLIKT
jgi:predicted RND superfamily exporter protein